jgi:hypothetical protein
MIGCASFRLLSVWLLCSQADNRALMASLRTWQCVLACARRCFDVVSVPNFTKETKE